MSHARPSLQSPADALGDTAGPAADAAPAELDTDALQRLRELDPSGANRLLERVFEAFAASAARLAPQMHAAHRAGDNAGVRHVVHTLKSSSASIGAIKLSQLCAEIETMIRLDALDGLAARLDMMDRELAVVLEAVQNLRDQPK